MVLVEAARNLVLPDASSAELVDVPAFGHQHVTGLERGSPRLLGWHANSCNLPEVQAARLYVGYTQVRAFNKHRRAIALPQGDSRLDERYLLEPLHLPMLRHVPQPLHAGGLEAHIGIEAAGDGTVDDGLLLLLQQLDQLLLGADVAADAAVGVVEEADDGGLFGEGREARIDHFEMLGPQTPHVRRDPVGPALGLLRERRSAQ